MQKQKQEPLWFAAFRFGSFCFVSDIEFRILIRAVPHLIVAAPRFIAAILRCDRSLSLRLSPAIQITLQQNRGGGLVNFLFSLLTTDISLN